MIATLRGLAIAIAIALALGAALVLAGSRAPAIVDRTLVPALDPAQITGLEWQREGQVLVRVARNAGSDAWRITSPSVASAEPRAVDDVLATLRAARWQRQTTRSAAGQVSTRLVIEGPTQRTIEIGQSVEGTEQSWLVAGDRAVLVDRWVARALDPGVLALHVRRPLERAATADRIALPEVTLEGHPRRMVARDRSFVVTAASALAVEEAAAAIEISELPTSPTTPGAVPVGSIELRHDGMTAHYTPGCNGRPDMVHLLTPSGAGCVPQRAFHDLARAVNELAIEPRPAPIEATAIQLPDGTKLTLRGRPKLGDKPDDRDADPGRVLELLAVLAAPAEVIENPSGFTATQTVQVTGATGTIVLELASDRRLRRAGETIALRLTRPAWDVLTRPARELEHVSLWVEDPRTINAVAIDGVTYTRGAVEGEWTVNPKRTVEPSVIGAAFEALAAPRAIRDPIELTQVAHRVKVTVVPPAGGSTQHALEVGSFKAAGCAARVDGKPVTLGRELCDAIRRLAPPATRGSNDRSTENSTQGSTEESTKGSTDGSAEGSIDSGP